MNKPASAEVLSKSFAEVWTCVYIVVKSCLTFGLDYFLFRGVIHQCRLNYAFSVTLLVTMLYFGGN